MQARRGLKGMRVPLSMFAWRTLIVTGILLGWPFAAVSQPPPSTNESATRPAWLGNRLGEDALVLPGFEPIRLEGTRLELGDRTYVWEQSYLPVRIDSVGRPLTGPMRLELHSRGTSVDLVPDTVRVESAGPDHVVIVASGEVPGGGLLRVTTRVEYDGVGMVDLRWVPDGSSAPARGLDLAIGVERSPATVALGFAAEGFRRQKNREDVLTLPYSGSFLNVLDISDGDRSFWWFADHARGWLWDESPVTRVVEEGGQVVIRQRLVAPTQRVEQPVELSWNFMATPVRNLGTAWRAERILQGSPNKREQALGVRYGIWWTNALVHDALPYTRLDAQQKARVEQKDRDAYPGLEKNRRMIRADLERFGLHRIPYFSAHVLSVLDPVLVAHRERWEVDPPFVFKGAHAPWKQSFDRPVLSHNDPAYTDYLIFRVDALIDELDMSGIYLDHGPPFDSKNPHHGLWRDARGRAHPSLDILGTRNFLKRLATLFHTRGKPGYVFVHSSAREIAPAFAFVTSLVDGEQYRKAFEGGDYIGGLTLGEVRARFAPDQYGIRMDWLPTAWVGNRRDKAWEGSEEQRRAYRNFMTLVLLHGTGDWPAGAHRVERRRLVRALDDFGIAEAEFRGYWSESGATATTPSAEVSLFRHASKPRVLLVVANLAEQEQEVMVQVDAEALGFEQLNGLHIQSVTAGGEVTRQSAELRLSVPGQNFRLVVLDAEPAGSASRSSDR